MKQNLRLLLIMLLCAVCTGAWATDVTDVLNREFTGVTGTSYTNWSGKTATSDAVYAGNSAGGNGAIQLRSDKSNSGVVTTTSGGTVAKITVTWNSNTASGRILNVYGKNSAYSAATDLYSNSSSTQGTLLGTIKYGTSTELTIEGDYKYIGFRSSSGALYLDEVNITWTTGASGPDDPVIEPNGGNFYTSQQVTISAQSGCSIYYTLNNETPTTSSTLYTAPFTINETKTVKAIAVNSDGESGVALATFTKVTPKLDVDSYSNRIGSAGGDGTLNFIATNFNFNKVTRGSSTFYNPDDQTASIDQPDWITDFTISEDYKQLSYTVNANTTDDSRTACFKISYVIPDGNNTLTVETDFITLIQGPKPVKTAYKLYSGDLTEGDYVIYYGGKAMNNIVNSDRLQYAEVTPESDVITTSNEAIVWHIAPNGDNWTIQSLENNKFAAGTGAKNKAALQTTVDDKARWTVTVSNSNNPEYEFVNVYNADPEVNVNANLRNNGTYGFACYATTTGGALSLYKKVTPITATFKKKFLGYTSIYYSDKNLVVPENVTAHTYKVEGGKGSYSVDYEAGAVIPKGTGVILEYSDKNIPDDGITVVLEETTEAGTADPDNMLRGFDTAQETTVDEGENPENYYFYRYTVGKGNKSNKIGFYFADETGSQFTAGAHKIYLAVLRSQFDEGVNASYIEDDTTGIDKIMASTTQKGTYTLSGIQVRTDNLPKGIYIVNGKKMVIK